ncbi:DUF625-domain-containing protein [Gonapodya prolifera JEL478]|uniref:DUF625-domain-containing protein n=1 Tax=Gonapodya prolifera (strain JEL478) TaxID=1344416 RepID=A0A139A1T2_GONPJ|nr:DUF625-domain-containing protein [Gonapodya prolifera JEL478]|eukprot:KXS10737.1 DUF625-domain-containing protein [Gonapodya prolifera JEL478]
MMAEASMTDASDSATGSMRVKVYFLSDDGNWDDQGTGFVSVQFNDAKDGYFLIVNRETETPGPALLILNSRVIPTNNYQQQQETLIVWTEPSKMDSSDTEDLALSFEDAAGCTEVWEHLQKIIARMQLQVDDIDNLPTSAMNPHDDEAGTLNGAFKSTTLPPEPTLANLPQIDETLHRIARSGSYATKKHAAKFILDENYLDKMLNHFETAEDLEDWGSLWGLGGAARAIALLGDPDLSLQIVRDDIFERFFGALEYDERLGETKQDIRASITDRSKFKKLLPFPEDSLEKKIEESQRLIFLRETVFSVAGLDDHLVIELNKLIHSNEVEIVAKISGDESFLQNLFQLLREEGERPDRKKEVLAFLKELSTITKGLTPTSKDFIYKTLTSHGLFQVLENNLSSDDLELRSSSGSILHHVAEFDPEMIRSSSPSSIMDTIIVQFIQESDDAAWMWIFDTLRMVIESTVTVSEGLIAHSQHLGKDPDDFLNEFYDRHVKAICKPLLTLGPAMLTKSRSGDQTDVLPVTRKQSSLLNAICDILCFCIKNHGYRSKYFILGSAATAQMILLVKAAEKHVRLSAVRYVRTCLSLKDDFYNRHLMKSGVFSAILGLLHEGKGKNNVTTSAILELFEFIVKENLKLLVEFIATTLRSEINSVPYTETFKRLIRKHEQNQEPARGSTNGVHESTERVPRKPRARDGWASGILDDDEEAYFDNDEDDENQLAFDNPGSNAPLVPDTLQSPHGRSTEINPLLEKINGGDARTISKPISPRLIEFVKSDTFQAMETTKVAAKVSTISLVDYPDDADDRPETKDPSPSNDSENPTVKGTETRSSFSRANWTEFTADSTNAGSGGSTTDGNGAVPVLHDAPLRSAGSPIVKDVDHAKSEPGSPLLIVKSDNRERVRLSLGSGANRKRTSVSLDEGEIATLRDPEASSSDESDSGQFKKKRLDLS